MTVLSDFSCRVDLMACLETTDDGGCVNIPKSGYGASGIVFMPWSRAWGFHAQTEYLLTTTEASAMQTFLRDA